MRLVTAKQEDGLWRAEAHEGGTIIHVRIAPTRVSAENAVMALCYRKDQLSFIRKAQRLGFEVRLDYSGRGMYGWTCPAVVCAPGAFGFKGARTDSMVYLP